MKNLTASIPIANNIANITKWKIINFQDNDDAVPPYAQVTVQVQGTGNRIYGTFILQAFDDQPSVCLFLNVAPTGFHDQLITGSMQTPGAYTALTDAFWAGSQKKPARLVDLEAPCLAAGLLSAAFA